MKLLFLNSNRLARLRKIFSSDPRKSLSPIEQERNKVHPQTDTSWAKLEQMRNNALHLHGPDALNIIHKTLVREKIPYWLYAGTLLGVIRDSALIQDDTDIDIGVWYDIKQQNRLEKMLIEQEFSKNYEFSVKGKILEQRFEYKGVGIDFYYFQKEGSKGNKVYGSSFTTNEHGLYLKKDYFDAKDLNKIKTIACMGMSLCVPGNYDAFLTTVYENWKIRISKSDYPHVPLPNQVHYPSARAKRSYYTPSVHQLPIPVKAKKIKRRKLLIAFLRNIINKILR